jgi:hypothetical protein
LQALQEVARLPNREISMSTAAIVQKRLGIDLGLPLDQAMPAAYTRQAAEVTRRVMLWANKGQRAEQTPLPAKSMEASAVNVIS